MTATDVYFWRGTKTWMHGVWGLLQCAGSRRLAGADRPRGGHRSISIPGPLLAAGSAFTREAGGKRSGCSRTSSGC